MNSPSSHILCIRYGVCTEGHLFMGHVSVDLCRLFSYLCIPAVTRLYQDYSKCTSGSLLPSCIPSFSKEKQIKAREEGKR